MLHYVRLSMMVLKKKNRVTVIMACKPEKPRLLFAMAAEVFEHRDWSAFDTYGVALME